MRMTWEMKRLKVEEWETSGLSAKEWCAEEGVVYPTFIYWRKKLKEMESACIAESAIEWAEVKTKLLYDENSTKKAEIKISRGEWTVTVTPDVNKVFLMDILNLVGQSC